MSGVVLHLSPRPDDELIGAPATLMAMRDAGWRVVNLACGLGAPDQRARREAELREACRRAGFELLIEDSAEEAIEALAPAIVISPGPRDRHPAHERVAAAACAAMVNLLTELVPNDGGWALGSPRWLDPAAPLAAPTKLDARSLAHPTEPGEGDL